MVFIIDFWQFLAFSNKKILTSLKVTNIV